MSVLKNTPSEWPLYVIHTPRFMDQGKYFQWLVGQPWMPLARYQNREVFFREMLPECVGKTQNCLAHKKAFWNLAKEDFILLFQVCSNFSINF